MKLARLHSIDRWLIGVLVPIWLLSYGLMVRSYLKPSGAVPFIVSAWQAPDEFPAITGFREDVEALMLGDRVTRVGPASLRGAWGLQVPVEFMRIAENRPRVELGVRRGIEDHVVEVEPIPWTVVEPLLPFALAFFIGGIAILLRAPRSRVARAAFHLCLAGSFSVLAYTGSALLSWSSLLTICTANFVAPALCARFLILFPHGNPPRTLAGRLLPWPWALIGAIHVSALFGFPFSGRSVFTLAAMGRAFGFAAALVTIARIYRRSDPVGRRKLRLAAFGIYLAVLPAILEGIWSALGSDQFSLRYTPAFSFTLVPAFLYLALYRYDIFDVDRAISAAAAFNAALVALGGFALLLVPRAGEWLASQLGLDAVLGQGALSLAFAGLVVPAGRALRPYVDRVFFRDRQVIERGIEALREEIGEQQGPKGVLWLLGRRLHDLMNPESMVVYGSDGDRFGACFVEGRGVAPELDTGGPVLATFRSRLKPIALDTTRSGSEVAALDPFQLAALEALNAAVLVPIADASGRVEVLLCLGPKRSGDVYTQSEIRLLGALADRAALTLQRFDHEKLSREGREMSDTLRRYVPGAIAEHLDRGDSLEAGERDVAVLFVDIRGYTALSDGRRAEEIFSTVNQYTERVSRIVRAAGGSVVEFNGDGLMAVFGAPQELPDKERSAVRAGRAIVEDVGTLELNGQRLAVGVGVASGPAYVGNIQAADRLIWSAIGSTTNRAARLQALTRDLDAAMIVDEATHAALGTDANGFVRHPEILLRGLSGSVDVFALPAPKQHAPAEARAAAVFAREGQVWTLEYEEQRVQLPDAKGLWFLQRLLAQPGAEIHVRDLVASVEGTPTDSGASGVSASELAAHGVAVRDRSGGDEMLDEAARAQYRARIADLQQEIEEAERNHDAGRIERAREELEFIEQELSVATGLGGRRRRTGGDDERARKAVYNRIQHVYRLLNDHHPGLARHLEQSVETGTTCVYRPEHLVEWRLG